MKVLNTGGECSEKLIALIAGLYAGDTLIFSNINYTYLLNIKTTANDLVVEIR